MAQHSICKHGSEPHIYRKSSATTIATQAYSAPHFLWLCQLSKQSFYHGSLFLLYLLLDSHGSFMACNPGPEDGCYSDWTLDALVAQKVIDTC